MQSATEDWWKLKFTGPHWALCELHLCWHWDEWASRAFLMPPPTATILSCRSCWNYSPLLALGEWWWKRQIRRKFHQSTCQIQKWASTCLSYTKTIRNSQDFWTQVIYGREQFMGQLFGQFFLQIESSSLWQKCQKAKVAKKHNGLMWKGVKNHVVTKTWQKAV